MAYFNILSKTDQALVAYLISKGAGTATDVWPGKSSEDKTLPCTIVKSHSAKPLDDMPYSGNRIVQTAIFVRTAGVYEEPADNEADKPRLDNDERVAATWDCFQMDVDSAGDKLGDAITAAFTGSDFTVLNCKVVEETCGFEGKGDGWSDVLHIELLVCPATGV